MAYRDYTGSYLHRNKNYEYINLSWDTATHRLPRYKVLYKVKFGTGEELCTWYADQDVCRIVDIEKQWILQYPLAMLYPEGV